MSIGTRIFIRANASDEDGQVAAVHFYADGDLLGTVTNAPYTFQWFLLPKNANGPYGTATLTAVAEDNFGATNISLPVAVQSFQPPTDTRYHITMPSDAFRFNASVIPLILAAESNFPFSAEMLTSDGYGNPAVFFIATNVVGLVVDPPYSITVTNWPEGEYGLTVASRNGPNDTGNFAFGSQSLKIKIVPLLMQRSQFTTNGLFSFLTTGRVAGKATVIEASTNLVTWQPIATNITGTNSFLFTDPQATNFSRRFYRASFKE